MSNCWLTGCPKTPVRRFALTSYRFSVPKRAFPACLELLVMADELISGFKKMFAEIPMDDESMGLDMIDRVGPGKHFLTENHTIDRIRQTWHPDFFDRDSFAGWEETGSLTMETKLNQKLQWILENHRCEPLSPEVRKEIEAVIARAEAANSEVLILGQPGRPSPMTVRLR